MQNICEFQTIQETLVHNMDVKVKVAFLRGLCYCLINFEIFLTVQSVNSFHTSEYRYMENESGVRLSDSHTDHMAPFKMCQNTRYLRDQNRIQTKPDL